MLIQCWLGYWCIPGVTRGWTIHIPQMNHLGHEQNKWVVFVLFFNTIGIHCQKKSTLCPCIMHASAESLLRVIQLGLAGGNLGLAAYGT